MPNSILIKNAYLIATLDAQNTQYKNADLYIMDNKIKDIGERLNYKADNIIDATNKLVLPGFVNTHHHFYQTLTRAIPKVQNVKLFDWLINLYEVWRELTPEAVYISTLLALGELMLTGCTTTTDHLYLFPKSQPKNLIEIQIKAASEIGMRFHPTRGSMSRSKANGGLPPDDVVQTEMEIIEDSIYLIEKYHNPHPFSMCRIALAPCSPFSVTSELLKETAKLARMKKVRLHTHLAETQDEIDFCIETLGMRPLAYMESMDWLGSDVWYAHCVHLNDSEIKLMAETGTGVAHCPTSNLRLGSGIAPIPKMLEAGVPVSIAVDGSASNDASDMLPQIRIAFLVHRIGTGVASTNALQMLRVATSGGAKVLGHNEIGTLEIDKAADVIMFDLNNLGYAGALHDPLAAILFAGYDHRVHTNIINGEITVQNGQLVKVDTYHIINEANRLSKGMIERAIKKTGIDFLG